MFSKAALLLAFAASAFANVFMTSPTASSVLAGGQEAVINWIDDNKGVSLADFGVAKLSIAVGGTKQQTSLQTIIANVDVSTTSTVKFTVDPNIGPDSSEYFIRCESVNFKDPENPQFPALAFSAKFKMQGMKGTFSPEILQQIAGQGSASVAGATSPATGATNPAAAATTTGGSSAKTSSHAPTSTKSAANTTKSNAATTTTTTTTRAGWLGIVVGAIVGASMF